LAGRVVEVAGLMDLVAVVVIGLLVLLSVVVGAVVAAATDLGMLVTVGAAAGTALLSVLALHLWKRRD